MSTNHPQKPSRLDRKATDSVSLDTVAELLHNPRKLWWLNFKTGLTRGFAGVLGAALAIVIIGFLVAKLGGLPIVGDFLREVGNATSTSSSK